MSSHEEIKKRMTCQSGGILLEKGQPLDRSDDQLSTATTTREREPNRGLAERSVFPVIMSFDPQWEIRSDQTETILSNLGRSSLPRGLKKLLSFHIKDARYDESAKKKVTNEST